MSPPRSVASASPRNPDAGKLRASSRRASAGDRRRPGGSRVRTEYVSNQACPARPSRRPRTASSVATWASWSSTTSATAVLVSSSATWRSSASVSVRIDQLADQGVVDGCPRRRDEQQAAVLSELRAGNRLDADRSAFELDLHLATASQSDSISQTAWDYHTTSPIDGCPHGSKDTTTVDAGTNRDDATYPEVSSGRRRNASATPIGRTARK